jgi:hypothetical protein
MNRLSIKQNRFIRFILCCQFAAFLSTFFAGGCTSLAVIVIVLATLFGAPIADFRTQATNLFQKWAIHHHKSDTQLTNFRTLYAAVWAIIVT